MTWSLRIYSMHFSQALLASISSHAAASVSATTSSKDVNISAVLLQHNTQAHAAQTHLSL
jgi:hypothetical protein